MSNTLRQIRLARLTQLALVLSAVLSWLGLERYKIFRRFRKSAYFIYKRWFEDPFESLLRSHQELTEGKVVLDVGAHIGFTATTFDMFGLPSQVFAFEPEHRNFLELEETLKNIGGGGKATPVRAIVGDFDGELALWANRNHHGDHRVATQAFLKLPSVKGDAIQKSIPALKIDTFVKENKLLGKIGFIKIDVQGYELPVIKGALHTIEHTPDIAIAFEYTPYQSKELGFEPGEIFELLKERGFRFYLLSRRDLTQLSEQLLLEETQRRGYIDILAVRQGVLKTE